MLICEWNNLRLGITGSGHMLPWLGPALRGMVGLELKKRVCRHSPQEQRRSWTRCKGCPLMAGCPYGETFEREAPSGASQFGGQDDAVRPLVLAPYYPLPERADPGLELPLRMVLVGSEAVRHGPALLDAVALGGRNGGLGYDRIQFRLIADRGAVREDRLGDGDFPSKPDSLSGVVPRLGVGLTAPLFLRKGVPVLTDRGSRRRDSSKSPLRCPQFADLFRAALRTIGRLFAIYEQQLSADFGSLKKAAEGVRMIEHCYEPFRQKKWSTRGEQRYFLHGCTGGGVYANVPLSLLPWILWGGRLNVGGHRVAGAGGWRLVLD